MAAESMSRAPSGGGHVRVTPSVAPNTKRGPAPVPATGLRAVRLWWRVSKRGRWHAISKRRAFRALMPGLIRELDYLEVTGCWPVIGIDLAEDKQAGW